MSKKYVLKHRVKLALLCIYFTTALVLVTIISQYMGMSRISDELFQHERQLLNKRLLNRFENMERTYLLAEDATKNIVVNICLEINKLYEREENKDFNKIDLNRIKQNNEWINIYIINKDNVIIKSTDEKELNMDFKKYKEFSKKLDDIRNRGKIFIDKSVQTINSGEVKRFVYMPTRDKQYIIEISTDMSKVSPILSEEQMLCSVDKIIKENKFIENIKIYDEYGHVYLDKLNEKLKRTKSDITLKEAIKRNEKIVKEYDGKLYEYVPYTKKGVMTGFIVIYNKNWIKEQLWREILKTASILLVLIVIIIKLSYNYINKLSKPIENLVSLTKEVRQGNFKVRAEICNDDEVNILSQNLNSMLDYINILIEDKKHREEKLTEQNCEIRHKNEEIHALYEQTIAMNGALSDLLEENQEKTVNLIKVLVNSIEAKDEYLKGHCNRVMEYSVMIAKELSLSNSDIMTIKYGSILHDIGKIGIAEDVLNKKSRFTNEEYNIIKKHPEIGYGIIKDVSELNEAKRIVYEHHERIDGLGYPQGLKGDEIHLLARIVSVADAYDAMTSKRAYRQDPLTTEEAIDELIKNSSTQFDKNIVQIFIKSLKSNNKVDN